MLGTEKLCSVQKKCAQHKKNVLSTKKLCSAQKNCAQHKKIVLGTEIFVLGTEIFVLGTEIFEEHKNFVLSLFKICVRNSNDHSYSLRFSTNLDRLCANSQAEL